VSPKLFARGRALAVIVLLTAVPVTLGYRVLSDVLASFHWSFAYIPEIAPWLLLLAGVAFLVPVAASAGLDPESRFYPRDRRAYYAWGVSLYVLGAAMAIELFEVWSYAH
jgi:MFS superfamily sulfate permease-like transporter